MDAPARARRVGPTEITFFFTAFVAVTYAFGIYLFAALIPDMRVALQFDQKFVGLSTGLSQGGLMVAAFLASVLTPLIGPMRIMLIAIGVNAAGLLAMAVVSDPIFMVPLMAAFGGCAGATWIAIVAIAPDVLPARHQGKLLGLMSSGTAYGVFLNGLIVPPLVSGWGWRSAWLTVGLASTVLLAAAAWRLAPLWSHSTRRSEPGGRRQPGDLRALFQPTAILITAILFIGGFVLSPFQTYLSSLLREGLGWQ
ncbi:MAG TPA: MFS transporter, partial [Dongiaceae bacterium]|nr:MFS transporter [Dongiaceae bacterium]